MMSKVDIYLTVPSTTASWSFTLPAARLPRLTAAVFARRLFFGCESSSDMGDILSVDISDRFQRSSHEYDDVRLSLCRSVPLFVCLSVTLVDCDHRVQQKVAMGS